MDSRYDFIGNVLDRAMKCLESKMNCLMLLGISDNNAEHNLTYAKRKAL